MEKHKTLPQGYMTVGELAKKMQTTVRTLQYYDKVGLLSPSAESDGGRRLYTHKDMIKLHQILSLKSLGFSLDDIKNHLASLDTPADVANVLTEQAAALKEKIETLSDSLKAIEALREEVLQMQTVDFKKYADIITNLQMKNEFYWLIKHFDEQTLDHIRNRFDKESALSFLDIFNRLVNEATGLQKNGILPDDAKAQDLAKTFWELITEFTDGDMSMLPKLIEFDNSEALDNEWKQKQSCAIAYIEPALEIYFLKLGINPFEEG